MFADDAPHGSGPLVLEAVAVGRRLLVVAGYFGVRPGARQVRLRVAGRLVTGSAMVFHAASSECPGLVVIAIHDTVGRARDVTSVRFRGGVELPLDAVHGDIARLLRAGLSAAPVTDRHRALDFLAHACAAGADTLSPEVSRFLTAARSILREQLPTAVIDAALGPAARVEVLLMIDERMVYVRGWVGHEEADLAGMRLVSPEGDVVDLPPTVYRHPRSDVASFYGLSEVPSVELGFASLCTFDVPSAQSGGWLLEVETKSGDVMEATCPPMLTAPREVRDHLISELTLERAPSQALRVHHVVPAIARVQERLNDAVRIVRVEQFGTPPGPAEVSIVIPLYRRIEFVEHQLAQFVHDAEIAETDLVYVLDSPELERQLLAETGRLARLYRVPFRVAVLSTNGGFSIANNLGVSIARGRLVLLMNSDVLPDRPGWLGDLCRFHDAQPNPGAVGPKLVYEDESIQHAGMYFERPPGSRLWFNEHFYKGLHRGFPAANESRRVPAVSAACLLMRRDLYDEIGGLRGGFIQGDFEDSDLCLRLHEAGYENWYAAGIELFHLEGQSYPSLQRHANAEFNRWLHTHLWDRRIESLMASVDPVSAT